MIRVKRSLSIPSATGKGCNFEKLFYYDTHELKNFPIYAYYGLFPLEILKKIPNCKYEYWKEGKKTVFQIRIRKGTITCIFSSAGICTKADLFPDG